MCTKHGTRMESFISTCDSQPEGPALEIVYMDYSDEIEEETYKVWFEEGKCI